MDIDTSRAKRRITIRLKAVPERQAILPYAGLSLIHYIVLRQKILHRLHHPLSLSIFGKGSDELGFELGPGLKWELK